MSVRFAFVEIPIESSVIGGRYLLDRKLGSGGEGAVYLAYDQLLNRHVAIKCVHSGADGLSDASGAFAEARKLASLQHPNIVTIYDFLPCEENVFVVMEFINGESLDRLTAPLEAGVFCSLARQCLEALGAAHALGMVHRDIKSANIMTTWTEAGDLRVKLLDFGLAKVLAAPSEQTLDHSGALTGSIYFLSPEQLNCQPIDHRTDLYSLGCAFYRALTLRHPFDGAGVPGIIAAHLQNGFVPLSEYRPDLPTGIVRWVERLFSYLPDDRPESAAAALADLEIARNAKPAPLQQTFPNPAKANTPKPARRIPMWLPGLFALVGIGILLAIFGIPKLSKKPSPPPDANEKRDSFTADERSAIAKREGQTTTVTGDIAEFREEGSRRILLFKDSKPGDVALSFTNSEQGNFSSYLLKTFVGSRVTATGMVSIDGKKLLLDVPNMAQLRKQIQVPNKATTQAP